RGFPTEEKFPSQWRSDVETFAGGKLFDEGQSPKSKDSAIGRALYRMQDKTFKWRLATCEKVRVHCNARKNHSKVGGNFYYSFTILDEERPVIQENGIITVDEGNNQIQAQ